MLSALILVFLIVALIWTYATLIKFFISYFAEKMSNRKVIVSKVFHDHVNDHLDKELGAE